MDSIRWGILGTGRIGREFAAGLRDTPNAETLAVGSRTEDSARDFASSFRIARYYGSYAELVSDPDVDVIYVATPHPLHAENVALCLEAGKHVLCEKPMTVNAAQAERLIALAQDNGLFLMEGMWTRFFPLMERVRHLISSGAIGEPRLLHVDFGFRAPFDPLQRLFNPDLGGGALLDVGVYCVSLSSMIFGPPDRVAGLAHLGETGVDEQSAAILEHGDGCISTICIAIRTATPQEAVISGTEGMIRIHPEWWKPDTLTLSRPDNENETINAPYIGNGFPHEAADVMRCIRTGALESDVMPLRETLGIARTMDDLRRQWGLVYPGEQGDDL
jgi:dihydrodiol dehydrogenase / D-xylose 1-dehydrogenase (NADP)